MSGIVNTKPNDVSSSSSSALSFTVRNMTYKDIDFVLTFGKELGWRMGKDEPEIVLKIDPESGWITVDNETGETIGMLIGINHSPTFALITAYAVKEKYRGNGIGQAMWSKMMQHIGSERNCALAAFPSMFPIYKDLLGFSHIYESTKSRHIGKINANYISNRLIKTIDGIEIVKVDFLAKEHERLIEKIEEYDLNEICDNQRQVRHEEYLNECMKVTGSKGVGSFMCAIAFNQDKDEYRVKGFCLCLLSNSNTVLVQPLYADNKEIAELLLYHSLSEKFNQQMSVISRENGITMQIFDGHQEAKELMSKLSDSMECVANVPLLFNKKIIHGNNEKIFFTFCPFFNPF